MPKTIVFCADGTYNGPAEDESAGSTNVFKLFLTLQGDLSDGFNATAVEQEKVLLDTAGSPLQVAKYIHGVGNAAKDFERIYSGAVGSGVIQRVVRGYTFLSRNYSPGDHLVIIGFSRGAYTARALADMVASQGLLDTSVIVDNAGQYDREKAHEEGGKVWRRYRNGPDGGKDPRLLDWSDKMSHAMHSIFRKFGKADPAEDESPKRIAVDKIKAVAVWDTVGALGIPLIFHDSRYDPFRFTNTNLSPKVEFGFHAVSLDEQRVDFTPTLWTKRENVKQVLFAGVHSDVGGGYPVAGNQSGLSDIALGWMADELRAIGVLLQDSIVPPYQPDYKGPGHREHFFGQMMNARVFPADGVEAHPTVKQRAAEAEVVSIFGQEAGPYQPGNLP